MPTVFLRQDDDFLAMSLEDRRKYSLEAIKEVSEAVYQKLVSYEPITTLNFDEEGNPDMLLEEVAYFNYNYLDLSERRNKRYTRVQLSHFTDQSVDEEAGQFMSRLYKEMEDKKIDIGDMSQDAPSYYYVSFGVAFGAHLLEDIEKYAPAHLVLIEPNVDLLFHSLSVLDWRTIVDKMNAKQGSIHFILSQDEENIASGLLAVISGYNFFEIDGMVLHHHYDNPSISGGIASFKKRYTTVLQALGFFFDETIMLTNAHRNLWGGQGRLYKRQKQKKLNAPVFIVGSGPSLDKDLPHIKKWQDKAIIISCGSAILPLLSNDIQPDFQVELENVAIERMMSGVAEKYDLSSICLVSAVTVQPSITQYFQDIIYYHRESLSPFLFLSGDFSTALKYPGPTVVNTGLGFAQETGFKQFYLFGADMGKRDPDGLHHSKDTYHYTPNANSPVDEYNYEVKANFGGVSYASEGLYHAKTVIDTAMRTYNSGCSYYNCSDGAAFMYALPFLSERLKLSEIPNGKRSIVSQILGVHPTFSMDDFHEKWDDDLLIKSANHYVNGITKLFCAEDFSLANHLDVETFTKRFIKPNEALADWASLRVTMGTAVVFRGTIIMALIGLRFLMHRLNEEDQVKLEQYGKEAFLLMLEDMKEKYEDRVGYLTKRTEAGEDTFFLDETFI